MGDHGSVPSPADAEPDEAPPPRRVGRPRKWASDAERKRAYRQRLAADLDDVLGLRRDLRRERQRAAALERHNQRLRSELDAAGAHTVAADARTATATDRIAALETELERTRTQLFEARSAPAAHSSPSDAPVRAPG